MQQFDNARQAGEREPCIAVASPSGQAFAVGTYDRIRMYTHNGRRNLWEEASGVSIPQFYAVTALAWKADGARLVAVCLAFIVLFVFVLNPIHNLIVGCTGLNVRRRGDVRLRSQAHPVQGQV